MMCLNCNNPLTQWVRIHWKLGDDELYGDPPKLRSNLIEVGREEVGLGYEGNGHFCSMHCGWKWALVKAKRAQQ